MSFGEAPFKSRGFWVEEVSQSAGWDCWSSVLLAIASTDQIRGSESNLDTTANILSLQEVQLALVCQDFRNLLFCCFLTLSTCFLLQSCLPENLLHHTRTSIVPNLPDTLTSYAFLALCNSSCTLESISLKHLPLPSLTSIVLKITIDLQLYHLIIRFIESHVTLIWVFLVISAGVWRDLAQSYKLAANNTNAGYLLKTIYYKNLAYGIPDIYALLFPYFLNMALYTALQKHDNEC